MPSYREKIVARSQIKSLAAKLRETKKTLVMSNGCFDLLHLGHIDYLAKARELGGYLIVGINSDASVRKIKGPSRPIFDETTRSLQIAALESVDCVFIFSELTPVEWLNDIRPQIHVKGADYADREIPERPVVESWGGRIELVPFLEGYSTTDLIKKLKMFPDEKGSPR